MNNSNFRIMGAYFGYPQCCIDQFCTDYCHETKEVYPHLLGQGYVPCMACARRIDTTSMDEFVAQYIAPARRHHHPFPAESNDYMALARAYLYHYRGLLPRGMPLEVLHAAHLAIAIEGLEEFTAARC